MADARNLYTDGYWWSNDEVRLHYRDYGHAHADNGRPPILCFAGLTRNARDYSALAERLANGWRVITVDFRGRGESGYAKDPMSYAPLTYLQDVEGLLEHLGVERFIAFGTSLGGIVTMLLASAERHRIVGALLNDVGPELDPSGLARIRSYVGRAAYHPTWMHAARALAEANRDVHPRFTIEDWLAMAKRLFRLNAVGRIVYDYDMKIAEPFRVPGNEAGPDMWRTLDALAGKPVLVVRGATSDILSAASAEAMILRLGQRAELVTIPECGHAPTLVEPETTAAIDRLLAKVAAEPVPA
jgi:pimeloyl-ACP methyl ester carboxylesterase